MQKKGGYGIVYQEIMRNSNLSAEAKAIYAYLSSIAGVGGTCYPSLITMQRDLGMSRNRITKHINQLLSLGIVGKTRKGSNTGFGPNVYKVTHEIKVAEELQSIFHAIENGNDTIFVENVALQNEALQSEALQNEVLQNNVTNNNNINNNNINNNNIDYSKIAALYNSICVSFPKLTKLSDKRKKTIRARFNQGYTIDDFKQLFELAEGSSFLKGGNGRNWSANFDWLIADANMAKTLDGNYSDRQKERGGDGVGNNNQSRRQAADFYEQFMGAGNGD